MAIQAAGLALSLLCYGIAGILQNEIVANFFSAANVWLAFFIVFEAYRRNRCQEDPSLLYRFAAVASFLWALADTGWATLAALGRQPDENQVLWFLYALPNLMLAMSVLITMFRHLGKWSAAQWGLDSATVVALCCLLMWSLFLEEDLGAMGDLLAMDWTSVASIALDITIGTVALLWITGMRSGKLPGHFRLYLVAAGLFCLVDLLYYYCEFHGLYTPNGPVDFLYALSFNLIAGSALLWQRERSRGSGAVRFSNVGVRKRWLILLSFPAVNLILDGTGALKTPSSGLLMLCYAGLFFLHWWTTKYIQLSIENATLLQRERERTKKLETIVQDQNQRIHFIASRDVLTRLNNRQAFLEYMEERIQRLHSDQAGAVMVLDIDRLNAINTTFGTDAGDYVICEVARRLQQWKGEPTALARTAGEEFGVLLTENVTTDELTLACERLGDIMRAPISFHEEKIRITVSLGLAVFHQTPITARLALQSAQLALAQAKSQGYGQFYLMDSSTYERVQYRMKIESLLKQSNVENDFVLFYQPQFSLPEGKLIGAEALIRWKTKELGYLPPSLFIPIAEETGLIQSIGAWVIREAIRQAIRWNQGRAVPLQIGINVSPVQLKNLDILEVLQTEIRESGINPALLDVEITENVMLENNKTTKEIFKGLAQMGLTCSIDDFGAGHASFGYLSSFPVHRIKLDKLLIDNMAGANSSGTFVLKSIIDMAKMLGVRTIAEGVETQAQLDALIYLGCDQVQGFLLGRPVCAEEFAIHLR